MRRLYDLDSPAAIVIVWLLAAGTIRRFDNRCHHIQAATIQGPGPAKAAFRSYKPTRMLGLAKPDANAPATVRADRKRNKIAYVAVPTNCGLLAAAHAMANIRRRRVRDAIHDIVTLVYRRMTSPLQLEK